MPKKTKPSAKKVRKVTKPKLGRDVKTGKQTKSIQVNVVGVDGKTQGKVSLPGSLFAAKVNKQLLAQAVRVYLANQRRGTASTKTRGEVEGSTRKIYRQKGTGKARHGAIRAPIFVGGGIVFGPQPRDYSLSFPKKMKRAALASALTSSLRDGNIVIVNGLETLQPKTKVMAAALTDAGLLPNTLLVVAKNANTVVRAARNIASVDLLPAQNVHTYAVLAHQKIMIMKDALSEMKETFHA